MDRDETKARERAQDPEQKRGRTSLDSCYGRIGIPAVAAALTPRPGEKRPQKEPRVTPYDRD